MLLPNSMERSVDPLIALPKDLAPQPNGPISQANVTDVQEQYLSRQDFAALAGISESSLTRYLAAGRVPFFQPGGPRHRMTIPRSALESLTVPAKTRERVAEPQTAAADQPKDSSRNTRRGPKPKWLRNT